jgi:hypothetical protein
MFISLAPAPYQGVYQRQVTGLPQAEFIPQDVNRSSYEHRVTCQTSESNEQMSFTQHNRETVCVFDR